MQKIMIEDTSFVTGDNKKILFNGINLVWKNKADGYLYPNSKKLYKNLSKKGINLIRFGIFWSQLEPEAGVINWDYLEKIKVEIQKAQEANLYLFLDMHQDLFSEDFDNGAPHWVTVTDDLPHETGDLWSDAYFSSPALNRAIDHFWQDDVFLKGKSIQEHFFYVWQCVMDVVSKEENVIGFDILNEPYPGSQGQEVFQVMERFISDDIVSRVKESDELFKEENKQAFYHLLKDMPLYKNLLEALAPVVSKFELETLNPFYDKVRQRLTPHLNGKFLMFETSYFCNLGVKSQVKLKKGEVYAPHAYDLVVDTSYFENYSLSRLQNTLRIHRQVQLENQVPMILGEWGAYGEDEKTREISQRHLQWINEYQWGHCFWCYYDGFFETPTAELLANN